MGQHGSARLSVHSRLTIADRVIVQGWTVSAAAAAANVSRQTASKWVRRFRDEGEAGLRDRSTRPLRVHRRIAMELVRAIEHPPAHRTARAAPDRLGARPGCLDGLFDLAQARAAPPQAARATPEVIRYEWPAPGDLVHLDTKKLGRIDGVGKRFGGPKRSRTLGWDHVHVAIDDHSRLAYAEQLPDEHGVTAAAFLDRALGFFAGRGITVARVMTDNGSPYVSHVFTGALADRGIRHLRTRPYTPRTNGKAEAMVKILINSWAYARPYESSDERAEALVAFLDFYNHERPHGGLNGERPIDRVRQ